MSRFVLPFSFLILFNIQLLVFGEKRDAKELPVKVFILAGQSNMEAMVSLKADRIRKEHLKNSSKIQRHQKNSIN